MTATLDPQAMNLFARSSPSRAQVLQDLALRLQPLVARRQTFDLACQNQKASARQELERQIKRAGLSTFDSLLRVSCRQYLQGRDYAFDKEDFLQRSLILVYERLPQFDPGKAGFCTWLSECILRSAYTDLQRQASANYGRRQLKTDKGKFLRMQKDFLTFPWSLDKPFEQDDAPAEKVLTLGDTVPSPDSDPQAELLSEQCRDWFLKAVAALSEKQQRLLEEVYLHGKPQVKIAQELGVTQPSITRSLQRIGQNLATRLGPHFQDECGDSGFCRGLWRSKPGQAHGGTEPKSQSFAHAQQESEEPEGISEQVLGEWLRRSNWQGRVRSATSTADQRADAAWEEWMAQPASSPSSKTLLVSGAVAAGLLVAVAIWKILTPGPTDSPTVAQKLPSRTVPAPQPLVKEPVPPAPSPAGKSLAPHQSEPRTVSRKFPPARTKLPSPPRPVLQKSAPTSLLAMDPMSSQVRGASTDSGMAIYGQQLCRKLDGLLELPSEAQDITMLAVPLSWNHGKAEIDFASVRTILSGGQAQDRVLLEALRALQAAGLPASPELQSQALSFDITLDPKERPVNCQPRQGVDESTLPAPK